MLRPPDSTLERWALELKAEKPDMIQALAFRTVVGGREGLAWDSAVARGQVQGNIRNRVANYLFEPKFWQMFTEQQQIAIMRARCLYDLFWFTTAVLGYNKDAQPGWVDLDPILHGEMAEALVWENSRYHLYLVFRNSLKSTTVTIADSVRRYLLRPHINRLVVSDTADVANRLLVEIKSHFETNALFQKLWPERMPRKHDRWNENSITLPGNERKRQGTFDSAGIESNRTGDHYPEIVLDDVVTKDNSRTPEARMKILEGYRYYRSVLSPGGRFWVAGTRYNFDDLYAEMLRMADKDDDAWYTHIRTIYRDDGTSAWPALFPLSEIEDIKRTQGAAIFASQYLLNPVPEDSEFKQEWLDKGKYRREDLEAIRPLLVDIVTTVDPAFGESEVRAADYSCVMTSGITRAGDIYVLDCDLEKVTAPRFTDTMIDHWKRWSPSLIGVEAQAGQKGVLQMIQNVFDARQMVAHFEPITRGKTQDKDARIRQVLIPYFSNGKVHIEQGMTTLELMLRRFPSWKKDGLDALADAVRILRPRRRRDGAFENGKYEPVSAVTGR